MTITADLSMTQLLEIYPGARRALFARYHIGGCRSCAFRDDETLGQVCLRNNGLKTEEVIGYLVESQLRDREREVAPLALRDRIQSAPPPRLLDVRTREEHESVCLPGARLFTQEVLNEIMGTWKKDEYILIYDHKGGGASLDAAAYLEGHGFTKVKTLAGGIDAYSAQADSSLPRYRVEIEKE